MQLPTHFLQGIFLQALLYLMIPVSGSSIWWLFLLLAVFSVLGHVFYDCIAKATYHPPEADWNDWFWKGYHLIVYLSALIIAIFWIRTYWWAMIWSVMPDIIDWVVLRGILKKEPVCHPEIDKIRERFFKWVPDNRHSKITVLYEVILDGIVMVGILLIIFYP